MTKQVEFPGGGGDKLPDQAGASGKFLSSTGVKGAETWAAAAGGGDMLIATYDPGAVGGDAFDMDNMVEGAATLILTDTERAKLGAIAAGADVTADNAPQAHKASHENAGGDEISVAGLSGLLADDQHVLDSEVQDVINLGIRTALASLMSEGLGGAELELLAGGPRQNADLLHTHLRETRTASPAYMQDPHNGGDIEHLLDRLYFSTPAIRYVMLTCFEYTTDTATGDGKAYFHVPPALNDMHLVYAHAEVITAGVTATLDIEIYNLTQTTDMLSTTLTIDTTETGSDTAATPYVIDEANAAVLTNDVIRVDVDAVHSGTAAKGLIVTLGFQLP